MNTLSLQSRRGYTLVELLVVTSIFATAFGMLTVANKPSVRSQIRRGAQSLASVLVATQSRSLGREYGAAIILEPSADDANIASVIFNAEVLPPIEGKATGVPPAVLSNTTATATVTPSNADVSDLQDGYKICFYEKDQIIQPRSVWMQFAPPSSASSANGTVSLRGASGQSTANTIWPSPITPPFDVLIARYPIKASQAASLPKNAVVDLRFSGIGDDPSASYGSLAGKGAVAISFDRVGGIEAVMPHVFSSSSLRKLDPPVDPIVPIYLLVASRDDVGSAANTLASETSVWVVIHPQTGRAQVSNNVPQAATDSAALRAARAKARAGIPLGK